MLGPSGDVPIWQGFKALNASLSLFFNSQEKVFHSGVSRALTHFERTPPQFSPVAVRWWTHVKRCRSGKVTSSTQEQHRVPFRAVVRGKTFLCLHQQGCLYGATGLFGWMIAAVPAQMTPGLRVNRAVTGPVSPNDRAACPLFCPSLSTPIKSRNLQPKYVSIHQ